MMKKIFAGLIAVLLAFHPALAQNAGTVTNHAYAIGKGAGASGYTSLLCASGQLAIGSATDPTCRTMSADATLSAVGALTLATVNANVGTFGSATQAPQVTLDGKGRATAAVNVTVTPAIGSVTGLGAGCATFLGTPSSANLRGCMTDESGTGAALFAGGALGAATATSINGSTVSPGHYSGEPSTGSAAAGEIGEEITPLNVVSGSAVPLTTGIAANIGSLSVTAGDWLVCGTVVSLPAGGTTYTNFGGWISTTSATVPAAPNSGAEMFLQVSYAAGSTQILPVGCLHLKLASTTTVFLSTFAVFAVSTFSAYGFMRPIRLR